MPVHPTAIATWANAVTVTRVMISPLLFVIIPKGNAGSWGALALWFVLCSTDGIDGYLARRHGTTYSGAFLDPLADKILILGAMFTLVSREVFWIVPVVIIAAREVAISLFRVFKGAKGVSVPATRPAKAKTVAQQLAVAFALCPLTALDATWLWQSLLWIAVALALISGLQYVITSQRLKATVAHAV